MHRVSSAEVYHSVQKVTDAVHKTLALNIDFPTYHIKQKEIAQGFKQVSTVGFDNCGGCADGLLI